MARNHQPAWSRAWLRKQSWRWIQTTRRDIRNFLAQVPPFTERLLRTRMRRIDEEWDRRKRDGAGGMAAKMKRRQRLSRRGSHYKGGPVPEAYRRPN